MGKMKRFEDNEGNTYTVPEEDETKFAGMIEREGKVVREMREEREGLREASPWGKEGSLAYMGVGEIAAKTYGGVALKAAGGVVKSIPNLVLGAAQGATRLGEKISEGLGADEDHTISDGIGKVKDTFNEFVDLFTENPLNPNSRLKRNTRSSRGGGFFFSQLPEEQQDRIVAERGMLPKDFEKMDPEAQRTKLKELRDSLAMERGYVREDAGLAEARNSKTMGVVEGAAEMVGELKGWSAFGSFLKKAETARAMASVGKTAKALKAAEAAGTVRTGTAAALEAKTLKAAERTGGALARGGVPAMFGAERYAEMSEDPNGPGGIRQELGAVAGGVGNALLFGMGLPFMKAEAASPFLAEATMDAVKRYLEQGVKSGLTMAADRVLREGVEAAATAGARDGEGRKVSWNPKTAGEIVREALTDAAVGFGMHAMDAAGEIGAKAAYRRAWEKRHTRGVDDKATATMDGTADDYSVEQARKEYCPILNRQALYATAVRQSGRPVVKGIPGLENVSGMNADGSVSFNDGSTWRPPTEWKIRDAQGNEKTLADRATVTTGRGVVMDAETGEVIAVAANPTTWETVQKTAMERYNAAPASKSGTPNEMAGSPDWGAYRPQDMLDYQAGVAEAQDAYVAWKTAHDAWERDPERDGVEEPQLKVALPERGKLSEESKGWMGIQQIAESETEAAQVAKAAMRDVMEGRRSITEAWQAVRDALGMESREKAAEAEGGGAEVIVPTETEAKNSVSPERPKVAANTVRFLRMLEKGAIPVHEDCEVNGLETDGGWRLEGSGVQTGEKPVVVWIGSDGSRRLVSGARRVEAARAEGKTTVGAVYVREKEGWSLEQAKNINTVENLRDGSNDRFGDNVRALAELGVRSRHELEGLGITNPTAKLAAEFVEKLGPEMIREWSEEGRLVEAWGVSLQEYASERNVGEHAKGLQRLWTERISGQMPRGEQQMVLEVLAERLKDGTLALGDEKAVGEAIAEGRRRAAGEGGVVADAEPVETEDGRIRSVAETVAEIGAKGPAPEPKPVSETPLADAARSENRGVELKACPDGTMGCARFPEARIEVSRDGIVVEGLDGEAMLRPENIEDTAALLERLARLGREKGLYVEFTDEITAFAANVIVGRTREEIGMAADVAKRAEFGRLMEMMAKSTGGRFHHSLEDWHRVMNAPQAREEGQLWRNANGVYGLFHRGEIYINPAMVRPGAAIHEFGHLTFHILRNVNRGVYDEGVRIAKGSEAGRDLFERISANETYSKFSEEDRWEEVLAHVLERKGEDVVGEKGLGAELKAWVKKVWATIKGAAGLENLTEEDVADMTLDEFTDTVLAGMLGERRIGSAEGGRTMAGRRLVETRPGGYEAWEHNARTHGNAELRRDDMGAFVEWTGADGKTVKGSKGPYGEVIPDARYSRPWSAETPEVFVHQRRYRTVHDHESLWHQLYLKGKRGDAKAAHEVMGKMVDERLANELADRFPKAVMVPVVKPNQVNDELIRGGKPGINRNAQALAAMMARATGNRLKWTDAIKQTSGCFGGKPRMGGEVADHLLGSIDFGGTVVEGREYILVDDHTTMGTTFSALRQFIEENGGKVVACVALTNSPEYGRVLRITEETKDLLYERYRVGGEKRGETLERISENLRRANIAGGVDALTDGQGKALGRDPAQGRRIFGGRPELRRVPSRFDESSAWEHGREKRGGEGLIRFGVAPEGAAEEKPAVTADVFRFNPAARVRAVGDNERGESGLAAAAERRKALRPWEGKDSPASKAAPIAFDSADLTGLWRQLTGAARNPTVRERTPWQDEMLARSRGDRMEIVAAVFGTVDEGDVRAEKEGARKRGFFAHEDPAWCAEHSRAEIVRMQRKSEQVLQNALAALYERRVKTGEGGGRRATMVLAQELGHALLLSKADGGHSSAVGGAKRLLDRFIAEAKKERNRALVHRLEELSAWWRGVERLPEELAKSREGLMADAFGVLLTQPESMAEKAPEVYEFCRGLMAESPELYKAYQDLCAAKWSGKTDDRLLGELRRTWGAEHAREMERLRKASEAPSQGRLKSRWDDFIYLCDNRYGPMVHIAERGVKELKRTLDREVGAQRMTREYANVRLAEARRKVDALKSGLYDFQRSSDGEERLMVSDFADVIDGAKRADVSWDDVRTYAHLMRVIELGGRATAHGITPDRAARLLEKVKAEIGEEKYLKVEETWKKFRAVYEKYLMDDEDVMSMFDGETRFALRTKVHYVTMRHTMTPEEAKAYAARLAEQEETGEFDAGTDVATEIYMRINHGFEKEGEGGPGYEMERLSGSFDPTTDPIAETIKKAVVIRRAALRNRLVKDIRDVFAAAKVKGFVADWEGKFRSDDKYGSLAYMENGKLKRIVVPRIVEKAIRARSELDVGIVKDFGLCMRTLKNLYTIWNPRFVFMKAHAVDRRSVEMNVEGMRTDALGWLARTVDINIPFLGSLALPVYALDNFLARHTEFTKSWPGRLLYGENTYNHYVREAQKVAELVYEGKFAERLEEAKGMRAEGRTSEAAELEQRILLAREMMSRNVFQSKYKFDKVQRALSPEEVMRAYGIGAADEAAAKGLKRGWQATKAGVSEYVRYEEVQEAVPKIVTWLYDLRRNPERSAEARARLVIEQGGTPDLGARGIAAAWIENSTGIFWNVRKQGFKRGVAALADHPAEWVAKAIGQSLLPTVVRHASRLGILTALARAWLFGGDDERMRRSKLAPILEYYEWMGTALGMVPEYQQRNYNVIPVATFGEHTVFALRFPFAPEEYAIENAVHAVMNQWAPNPSDPSADLTVPLEGIAKELLPDLGAINPAVMILRTILSPFTGDNPYDSYRRREIFSENAMLTRWTSEGAHYWKEWGKNIYNYSPFGQSIGGGRGSEAGGGDEVPRALGAFLRDTPVVSSLPSAITGFYSDPLRGGLLKGLGEEDRKIMAKVRMKAETALRDCMRDGSLFNLDAHVSEAAGKDAGEAVRAQIYRFVSLGWKEFERDRALSAGEKAERFARGLRDGATQFRARQYIERSLERED